MRYSLKTRISIYQLSQQSDLIRFINSWDALTYQIIRLPMPFTSKVLNAAPSTMLNRECLTSMLERFSFVLFGSAMQKFRSYLIYFPRLEVQPAVKDSILLSF